MCEGKKSKNKTGSCLHLLYQKYFFSLITHYNKMNPTKVEGTSETAPLNSEGGSNSYFPIDTARKTASTNYFLA